MKENAAKEVAEKAAHEKKEAEAAENITNLIDSFNPPHRRSGIDYALKFSVQESLRAHVAKEKTRGVLMSEVLPKVSQFVEDKYREIQRNIEKM